MSVITRTAHRLISFCKPFVPKAPVPKPLARSLSIPTFRSSPKTHEECVARNLEALQKTLEIVSRVETFNLAFPRLLVTDPTFYGDDVDVAAALTQFFRENVQENFYFFVFDTARNEQAMEIYLQHWMDEERPVKELLLYPKFPIGKMEIDIKEVEGLYEIPNWRQCEVSCSFENKPLNEETMSLAKKLLCKNASVPAKMKFFSIPSPE